MNKEFNGMDPTKLVEFQGPDTTVLSALEPGDMILVGSSRMSIAHHYCCCNISINVAESHHFESSLANI